MPKKNRRQHGEGSVYQRKDGRWVTEIHLGYKPNGKPDRRYFYGATPEEVIEAREEFQRDRADGYVRTPGRAPTVEKWMWHWLEDISGARDSTKQGYRSLIKVWIVPRLGRMRLDQLAEPGGTEAIEAMYAAQRRAGLGKSTTVKTHAVLRRALNVAVKRRDTTKLKRNPCEDIENVGTQPRAEILPPEADEAAQILTATAGRRNGARWSVALAIGARQGEALGLLWPLVDLSDLDNATLRIDYELVRITYRHGCEDPHTCGKRWHRQPCPDPCPKVRTSGRPHRCRRPGDPKLCEDDCTGHAAKCPQRLGGLMLTEPKSTTSRRKVHLPRPLAEMLKAHRKRQAAERLALGGRDWTGWGHDRETCSRRPRPREVVCPACHRPFKPDSLVFAQPNGMPIDNRKDWQEWTDLLEELGLPHYRPHDGRHFAATLLLSLGVDERVVQEIVGHSNSAFTRNTYQHVAAQMQKDAAERIAGALWAAGDRNSDRGERAN